MMPVMNGRRKIKLSGVQLLRGVAVCGVLTHHVLEESQPLFGGNLPAPLVLLGASGVDLFFVISGFVMVYTTQEAFGQNGAAADFFMRRVLRIVPFYWLCTFAVVMAKAAGLYASKDIGTLSLASSLFFLPSASILLGVGWTLNYEMYFYGVFSIWLLSGSYRFGIFGILASIPLITILSWSLPLSSTRDFLGNPIALEFCFGCILAVACKDRRVPVYFGRLALLAGVIGLVLGTWFGPNNGTAGLAPEVRFLFWGLPAAALLLNALSVRHVKSPVGKVFLSLGDASYSIYLTHAFVMTLYAKLLRQSLLPAGMRPLVMLMPILLSIVIGYATYYFIEQPMSRRLRRSPLDINAAKPPLPKAQPPSPEASSFRSAKAYRDAN